MDIFDFNLEDLEGQETLETIALATKFNQWMYQTISAHCHGKILEIGSGIGNISRFFLENGHRIVLSDIREHYCARLKKNFPDNEVVDIDLVHPDFLRIYSEYIGVFDSVFALNVIEHIEDDLQAVTNLHHLVKHGGNCIILVPAFQMLYNSFDKQLFHYRRYTASSLKQLIRTKFHVTHSEYFNPVGIAGWLINGSLLGKKQIPVGQMKLFDSMVPLFKPINRLTKSFLGLSVIVVSKKL